VPKRRNRRRRRPQHLGGIGYREPFTLAAVGPLSRERRPRVADSTSRMVQAMALFPDPSTSGTGRRLSVRRHSGRSAHTRQYVRRRSHAADHADRQLGTQALTGTVIDRRFQRWRPVRRREVRAHSAREGAHDRAAGLLGGNAHGKCTISIPAERSAKFTRARMPMCTDTMADQITGRVHRHRARGRNRSSSASAFHVSRLNPHAACRGRSPRAAHRGQAGLAEYSRSPCIASDDRQQRLTQRRTVKDHVQIGTGKVWGTLLA